ncbi:MAG: hypothetical protein MJZ61_06025 [Bacteroidales bacterium]|nr:hypothetical protein [Bacteroidales bacterium]
MNTSTIASSEIDILNEIRHSITDFIYSTNDIVKLKKILEFVGVNKKIKYSETVSPSCDEWFDNPENIKMLDESIQEAERGEVIKMSMDDIRKALQA